jgi:hypothetical protein
MSTAGCAMQTAYAKLRIKIAHCKLCMAGFARHRRLCTAFCAIQTPHGRQHKAD